MMNRPAWWPDETKQVGTDYNEVSEVAAYDARHSQFRDIEQENQGILEALCLQRDQVLIDLGAGTGAFAVQAAKHCQRVYAVDVSEPMLDYARRRAQAAGIDNIEFCVGGFLSYRPAHAPVDALVTSTAFHHLTDFWKGMALQRLNRMLKPEGRLFMHDVIFAQENCDENISGWLSELEGIAGSQFRADFETHIREEFSTYDWIMEGLLQRAGFRVETKTMQQGVIATYLCTKLLNMPA
jgi:putative AdoMet-dependent methyltransferase